MAEAALRILEGQIGRVADTERAVDRLLTVGRTLMWVIGVFGALTIRTMLGWNDEIVKWRAEMSNRVLVIESRCKELQDDGLERRGEDRRERGPSDTR